MAADTPGSTVFYGGAIGQAIVQKKWSMPDVTKTHGPFWTKHLDKCSILLFLVLWELLPRLGGLLHTFVAPPSLVLKTLVVLFATGGLTKHIALSLFRATMGFVAAAAAGIPLGFFLGGGFRTLERLVNPLLLFLGQVNPFGRSCLAPSTASRASIPCWSNRLAPLGQKLRPCFSRSSFRLPCPAFFTG